MDDSNQPSAEGKKKGSRESKTSKMDRRRSRRMSTKMENGAILSRSPSISSRESFVVDLAADSMSGV
jgi:hypothetical protein